MQEVQHNCVSNEDINPPKHVAVTPKMLKHTFLTISSNYTTLSLSYGKYAVKMSRSKVLFFTAVAQMTQNESI
jgi:hypothetical protein